MPRKNSEDTVNNSEVVVEKKQRKQRTPMHTFRIVQKRSSEAIVSFYAIVDGKVVSKVNFDSNKFLLSTIADDMGSYDGFSKYIRRHSEEFTTIIITKSENPSPVLAMGTERSVYTFLDTLVNQSITENGTADLASSIPDTANNTN